jgi:hypothetical protein
MTCTNSSLDAVGRGTLATYALASAAADCLPTAADRLAYPSADAPLFALAMTAALCDAGALCDACKSKNRCRKTAPVVSFHILKQEQKSRGIRILIILAFYHL